ncbi:hypothetical protein F53441_6564 [Fusarium austroafricanum]|uniref:Major facilitator superfamily (MFS) profile domain-containing protein n=1 Tax=Fusarium austroafricanum TaxID=2364996 RepID=A0A8H4KH26_9HYPO|nr:hypothetical protein F53441_6564 [Fusarium austroafricanum]
MEQSNTRAVFLALALLGLLTLADCMTDSLLPALADEVHTRSGFWNFGALAIVLRGVSDFIGQIVLGYIISTKSKHCAMMVNVTSILSASVFTLLFLLDRRHWVLLVTVGMLHVEKPTKLRSAYYYATGAVTVLAQAFGPFLVSMLAEHSCILPGVLSALCCIISYSILDYLNGVGYTAKESVQDESSSLRTPLLLDQQQAYQDNGKPSDSGVSLMVHLSTYFGKQSLLRTSELAFLPSVFFLMAICKSTRPLFTTYIQHRDNVSATEAEGLWLCRSAMSVAIFGFIEPFIVLNQGPQMPDSTNINLHQARFSVLFISLGAFAIGLSGSYSTITTALIINTIGVATDLNILTFASTLFKSSDAGSVMMPLASIESVGTLLGIGVLYPLYQWSMKEDLPFLAGGVPYYICGTLYAVTACLLWSLKSKRQVTEP